MGSRSAPSRARRRPKKLITPLEAWGATQEPGWKTRLHERTDERPRGGRPPVAYTTIDRACRGINISLSSAKRISKATGGAVPYEALTVHRDEEVAA